MKKFLQHSLFSIFLLGTVLISCRQSADIPPPFYGPLKSQYTTVPEFAQGITQAINLIGQYNIMAYLDTMPNGFPNINGRRMPLVSFGSQIIQKLNGDPVQVESGVYDVFHFDGATFSLISYVRKAQMVGDISAQTMIDIIATIPLPPIPMDGFAPPVEMVGLDLNPTGDCCKDNICNPKIDIIVTWVHVAPCGNYDKKKTGTASGNELINMPAGQSYRFDAEISGCPCPGTRTSKVTSPAGAKPGVSERGKTVELFPLTAGTYTITFTYTVCGSTVEKTFTLGVK